jgi:hypothetical protein
VIRSQIILLSILAEHNAEMKFTPPLNKVGNVSGLVRVLEILEERLYCSRV